MKIIKNENTIDRLVRVLLAEILVLVGYFWLSNTMALISYVLALVMLVTSFTGFCALYGICKTNTALKFSKPLSNKLLIPIILVLIIVPLVGGYYSDFFSKKFFLEDYNRMNNYYKQTLFYTGQDNRLDSVANYEKLVSSYATFSAKYQSYHPAALKNDQRLNTDLQMVGTLINNAKDQVYNGDLKSLHTTFESVRPIFQDILKRNNFSLFGVALVDFHDSMEKVIAAADAKDVNGVAQTYREADEKLKAVEEQVNDDEIKVIRGNLEALLGLAKDGKVDELAKKGAELKSSFVKVYLKRG